MRCLHDKCQHLSVVVVVAVVALLRLRSRFLRDLNREWAGRGEGLIPDVDTFTNSSLIN